VGKKISASTRSEDQAGNVTALTSSSPTTLSLEGINAHLSDSSAEM
jgi:hypothetical protein